MPVSMLVRTIAARTHGRFLVEGAASSPTALLVGFHGYGENAERHLDQLRGIPGSGQWTLVAVQALHPFYAGQFEHVVASWMTRQDREQAIADNIEYVDGVMAAVTSEFGMPARLVYTGFSQGAAMAYRAAACGACRADGVIALGGDVPPDVQHRGTPASPFPRVLIGRGTRDAWYTDEKLRADLEGLRGLGADVTTTVYDGGHEWTAEFRSAAGEFLASLTPTKP